MNSIYEHEKPVLLQVLMTLGICAAGILFGELMVFFQIPDEAVILMYVLCVVIISSVTRGYWYGITATAIFALSYGYFVKVPVFSLRELGPKSLVVVIFMLMFSVAISYVTSKLKQGEVSARRREEETQVLYHLTKDLGNADTAEQAIVTTLQNVSRVFGTDCRLIRFSPDGKPEKTFVLLEKGVLYPDQQTDLHRTFEEYKIKPQMGYYINKEQHEWPITLSTGKIIGSIAVPNTTCRLFSDLDYRIVGTMAEALGIAINNIELRNKQEAAKQDVEQERFRSNLLRSISHDLRTPLAGISGTAEVLMSMLEENSQPWELASSIHRETRWLFDLVQNILSLTKLRSGSVPVKKELEVVEDVVLSAVETMKDRLPNRSFEAKVPEEVLTAPMDASLIRQVLINLMENAVKYSSGPVEVVLEDEPAQNGVSVSVMDHGNGISDEAMDKLFQIFYTTAAKAPEATRGFGLGLPICDSIMKAHNGSIAASNRKEGTGAVFTIFMPKS